MCGIAGVMGTFEPGLVSRMNSVQSHRGPDGDGVFESRDLGVALGHQRLAVLDLSQAGAQPMYSLDRRFVLVYNGELYNYQDLRRDLVKRSYTFRSGSDTEVLLYALIEYGEKIIPDLNGMFAFALWDNVTRQLLVVRDQLGIKPLYFAEPGSGQLVFASEIKAVLLHEEVRRDADFIAIQHYLSYGEAVGARTPLQYVKRLLPGHMLKWRPGCHNLSATPYWKPQYEDVTDLTRSQAVEQLRHSMAEATRRQLVADVPVGAFLSGGLDSSIISSLAAREHQGGFNCYTSDFGAGNNSLDAVSEDLPYARQLAHSLRVPLHEVEIQPDVAELWPKLIYHLDEPLADPAAITSYLISQIARENGTKVLLSGQGADELFGGYPRYMVMHLTRGIDHLPKTLRRLVANASRGLPGAMDGPVGAAMRRARRTLCEFDQPPRRRFLGYCSYVPQDEVNKILSDDVQQILGGETHMDECLRHMGEIDLNGVNSFLKRDLSNYLPNHNLLYTDKMGMATGLETRVPLLDMELVEQVIRYPKHWLFSGRRTKSILREAAQGLVSNDVIYRRKAGFGAPYRKWLRYDLSEIWEDVASARSVAHRGWFDEAALRDARQRSQSGKQDLYMLQWSVITMELWARRFIDQDVSNVDGSVLHGFN